MASEMPTLVGASGGCGSKMTSNAPTSSPGSASEDGSRVRSVVLPPSATGLSEQLVGVAPFPILGSEPSLGSSAKTLFKPTIPCETQQPPNLGSGGAGPAPRQSPTAGSPSILHGPLGGGQVAELSRGYARIYMDYLRAQQLQAQGDALGSNRLMRDVAQRFRAYDGRDVPLYARAIQDLTGLGAARIRSLLNGESS